MSYNVMQTQRETATAERLRLQQQTRQTAVAAPQTQAVATQQAQHLTQQPRPVQTAVMPGGAQQVATSSAAPLAVPQNPQQATQPKP